MTVLITLTIAGTDSGPFDLYSNLDGYTSAFESAVPKASLLAGYPSSLVPDFTTTIRVRSNNGSCTNYVEIPVQEPTTTTTSSSSTSTSTSSSSTTTSTSTTAAPTTTTTSSSSTSTTTSTTTVDPGTTTTTTTGPVL